jgi:hypothetical protein
MSGNREDNSVLLACTLLLSVIYNHYMKNEGVMAMLTTKNIIIGVVVLIAAVYGLMVVSPSIRYKVMSTLHLGDQSKIAQEQQQAEVQEAIKNISRHMIVPQNDQPVLAKVADAAALAKQQAFFAKAQNGDQLVIFPSSGQAILYRPSTDLLVNVGPIQFSQPPAGTAPQK